MNRTPCPPTPFRRRWATGLAALALAAALPAAWGDSGPMLPRHTPSAYLQECGSCHVAYPPGMLPARSWQRLMTGLERHYGSDASLDPATVQQLAGWLQQHAGTYKRVAEEPPQDRLTRSAWFQRKHREIDPAVWRLASVKSAAHCAACHTGAEQGRFDDDGLRFPAGLAPQHRRAFLDD